MGDGQFGSHKKGGPLRSWALRVAVAGAVLALVGDLVRTWDASAAGLGPTTAVGEAMLGVGGAVAVVALGVWLVQQLRH